MSESRAAILANIAKRLGRGPLDETARAKLRARMRGHAPGLIPARSQVPHAEQIELFREQAEAVSASVERLDAMTDVPAAVADFLACHNLPSEVAMAPDPALDICPWDDKPTLQIRRGASAGDDLVSVTGAFVAIAETGTLMLLSGPQAPTTLNFLPDNHIVVLSADDVIGTYEEGWMRLREQGAMPRTVNFITGPSRTADIEQKVQLGAHGPRRLHVLIVGRTAEET
jgi:L-lactate dehydrogenase complex protein LldG